MTKSRDWVATYHRPKGFVNPLNILPEDIHIEDIQHALANTCRFNGHCREFYSVAQHSVHVSEWLSRNGCGIVTQMLGLLHDGSEAYLGDIIRPLKKQPCFDEYRDIEHLLQLRIFHKFLDPHYWDSAEFAQDVNSADEDLLSSEILQLFNAEPKDWNRPNPTDYFHIKPISPRDAKLLFEERFHELSVALLEG